MIGRGQELTAESYLKLSGKKNGNKKKKVKETVREKDQKKRGHQRRTLRSVGRGKRRKTGKRRKQL